MYIEIETEDLLSNQINSQKTGKTYFTCEQPALMFTDDSKYPEHFNIRHVFSENKKDADSCGSLAKGRYQIKDNAYSIDRFRSVVISITGKTLKPIQTSSIPK